MRAHFNCIAATLLVATSLAASRPHPSTRQRLESIHRDAPHFITTEHDISDIAPTTQGSFLTAYHHNGSIRKLIARYYGESGHTTEEYFFWHGQLFFVLRTESHYRPLPSPDEGSYSADVIGATQHRFYFDHSRLTRLLSDRQKLPINTPSARIEARDLLKSARAYHALASNR